jgi:hypothetical protein
MRVLKTVYFLIAMNFVKVSHLGMVINVPILVLIG